MIAFLVIAGVLAFIAIVALRGRGVTSDLEQRVEGWHPERHGGRR